MTLKKHHSVLVVIMIVVLLTTVVPVSSVSAKTKTMKMTLYDQVIKKGKYAYCCDKGLIYKVNLKTNKVKKLIKSPNYRSNMKLYKGYIYYNDFTWGSSIHISRVKTNGKANKYLAWQTDEMGYVIKGKRIYYRDIEWNEDTDEESRVTYSIKLNGKNRKKVKYRVKPIYKNTNKKGYKVIVKRSSDFDDFDGTGYMISYLKKPNGKRIRLAKLYGKDFI